MDILPTLLDLTGNKDKSSQMHGVSFAPALVGKTAAKKSSRVVVSELQYHANHISGVLWPWKAIFNKDDGTWQFFNLERDPVEKKPLVGTDIPNAINDTLRTTIESYDSGELVSHSEEKESEIEYTAEELEVLKTLGYAM